MIRTIRIIYITWALMCFLFGVNFSLMVLPFWIFKIFSIGKIALLSVITAVMYVCISFLFESSKYFSFYQDCLDMLEEK